MPIVKDCVVDVEYLGLIRNVLQCGEEQCAVPSGTTVKKLVQMLAARHGEQVRTCVLTSDSQLRPMTEIYLNGRDIKTLKDLDTIITGESRVSILISVNAIPGG